MKSKPSTKKKPKKPLPFTDKGLYELEPEPTPEELAAMPAWDQIQLTLRKFNNGLDYLHFQDTAKLLKKVKAAHPLLAALEAAKTPAERKAAQAAIDGDAVASEVQRRLARFKEAEANANAYEVDTFRAGYEFAFAYLLATAGAAARRGRPMLKGAEKAWTAEARAKRENKGNALKEAVENAWWDYGEKVEPEIQSARHFAFEWLPCNLKKYGLFMDPVEDNPKFELGGKKATRDTVRRWLTPEK